jgi:hypothetical protein
MVCTSNGNVKGLEIDSCVFSSPSELIFWITYVNKCIILSKPSQKIIIKELGGGAP